jgi:predicted DNA-binding transcriptional regulator YafY
MLELLQARARIGGPELARRLEVGERTMRRYAVMLQEMGVPVEGERGRYGAYSLKQGYKMPPMMFTDEEALGLALGILAPATSVWRARRRPSRGPLCLPRARRF